MIRSANFKVNLGLYVTEKRPDGFHNLETIFVPIRHTTDRIEITPKSGSISFEMEGGDFRTDSDNNLCVKAFKLIQQDFALSGAAIRLEKNIPSGAGLGGGSSDAACVLEMTNELFGLKLTNEQLHGYAARLGSDVPFFLESRPMYATGRGEILQPITLDLSKWTISVFKPDFSISTAEAYAHVKPISGRPHLHHLLEEPIEKWPSLFPNDFENSLFPLYPILAEMKAKFYELGAVYASLSGSGSALFAIAPHPINLDPFFKGKNL